MPKYRAYFADRGSFAVSTIERLPDPPRTLKELLNVYDCKNIGELYDFIERLIDNQDDCYGLACQVED